MSLRGSFFVTGVTGAITFFSTSSFGAGVSFGASAITSSLTSGISVFSGVFYLKVPKNSGKINFMNPNRLTEYHFDSNRVENYSSCTSSSRWYDPQVAKMIIFPACVEHYVEGNNSDEDRISIAFNTKLDNE